MNLKAVKHHFSLPSVVRGHCVFQNEGDFVTPFRVLLCNRAQSCDGQSVSVYRLASRVEHKRFIRFQVSYKHYI